MGLDSMSKWGVTSSDVKACDSITLGQLAKALKEHTDPEIAVAALRLHMRPRLQLHVLDARSVYLLAGEV